MFYLLFFSFSIFSIYFADRTRCNDSANNAVLVFAVFFLALLPALQFNVGTDYFTYYNMTTDAVQKEIIFNKREYLFYYFIEVLSYFSLHGQWIFFFHSIVSSLLLVNILRKLRQQGYLQWIVLFLVVVVTGLLHNQMNGLRNILAVYIFLNAFIYKACGQLTKCALLAILGGICHQSFIVMALFLVLPCRIYLHLYSYIRFYYFSVLVFFGSGIFVIFVEWFITIFMPFYSHYLGESYLGSGVSLVNVVTKLYYVPLHLFFLLVLSKISTNFSRFDRIILGFWVLSASLYLGLIFVSGLFRAYHYVVFFGIFPIYFVLRYSRFNSLVAVSISLYLVVPYLMKVLVFAVGEYRYQSVLL